MLFPSVNHDHLMQRLSRLICNDSINSAFFRELSIYGNELTVSRLAPV